MPYLAIIASNVSNVIGEVGIYEAKSSDSTCESPEEIATEI